MSATQPTVGEVMSILESIAPPALAESWDSNRLIVGDTSELASRILLAVDPLPAVIDEAIERGVDMIITHHPLFLRRTDHVSTTSSKGRSVHRLIRAGISLANAHTSWDSAHGGVAEALALAVGLTDLEVLSSSPADPSQGIGRVGRLPEPTTLRRFAEHAARALPDSAPGLLVGGELEETVERIAVSGGSGDSLLGAARAAGADVFLTADLRHHPASDHLAEGKPYLLSGTHWATEWVGLPPLAQRLEEVASARGFTLDVTVSTTLTDPWALRLSTSAPAN